MREDKDGHIEYNMNDYYICTCQKCVDEAMGCLSNCVAITRSTGDGKTYEK